MATIRREIRVRVPAAEAWDAVRDFGNPHVRLFPGALTDSRLEENGALRVVTFAMGLVVRERLVTCDDAARRLCYRSEGGRLAHHNGVLEVFDDGEGARVVWTIDLLPDEMLGPVTQLVEMGCGAMERTLGR